MRTVSAVVRVPRMELDTANWFFKTGFPRRLCELDLPSRPGKEIHELSLTALELRAIQGIVFSPTPGHRTKAPPQRPHTIFATLFSVPSGAVGCTKISEMRTRVSLLTSCTDRLTEESWRACERSLDHTSRLRLLR